MNEINEASIQHFSKKVLFLSILFLLVSVAWYVISIFTNAGDIYRTVAPKLIFAGSQNVQVKTLYDIEYRPAFNNQELIAGTYIKTGDFEFAEIVLDNNVIRLDENTELIFNENNFVEYSAFETDLPRLVFSLKQGSIWVNAFDNISIKTVKSSAQFSHAVGIMTYASPMNRIMMVSGSADLTLFSEQNEYLITFMVPLYSQVTYTDTQIVPEYSQLKTSKLKKELKLAPIANSLLNDPWIIRNAETDKKYFKEKKPINSALIYKIKNKYYELRFYITFVNHTKRQLALDHSDMVLRYLLGGADESEIQPLLADLDKLTVNIKSDPLLKELFAETFFAIGTVEQNSSAYIIKEYLIKYLLSQDGPNILRTYLADLRNDLDEFNLAESKNTAETWLKKWDEKTLSANFNEFKNQSQIFHRIILSYADRVTADLLNIFDQSGDMRLKASNNSEEMRFDITEERLDISSALVASFRYLAAKNYLKNSYESLQIDKLQTQLASREIFLQRAKLLAQRIEYAEDQMHGAARAIDETEFKNYIQQKTRDQLLSENLKAFLEVGKESEKIVEPPNISEVIKKFSDARISVFEDGINFKEYFTFEIKNAYLMDRSPDGSIISFSALYDFTTNAVSNVVTKNTSLKGSFDLNDLVVILSHSFEDEDISVKDPEDISYLLTETQGQDDEALRAEITAQDLAKQLLIKEFAEAGVQVGKDQIEIVNAVTLTEFKVTEAHIYNPTDPKNPIKLKFDYNSSVKNVYNVFLPQTSKTIPGILPLNELSETILENVIAAYEKIEAEKSLQSVFEQNSLTLEGSNIVIESAENIQITGFRIKTLPLTVNGVYNLNTKKFVTISHELYSSGNIGIEEYFTELANLFVIDFLNKNNISVSREQIEMEYPFYIIKINNYIAGDQTFSFEIDISSNRLKNITLIETGVKVNSMTFSEFNLATK